MAEVLCVCVDRGIFRAEAVPFRGLDSIFGSIPGNLSVRKSPYQHLVGIWARLPVKVVSKLVDFCEV